MPARKVVDLTPEEYRRLKLKGMKDKEIAVLSGVGTTTFCQWKKDRGLQKFSLKPQELTTPVTLRGKRKLNRLIQSIKDYRGKYWSNEAIAKELGIALGTVSKIITLYLPEEKRTEPHFYTEEQKERARKAGVAIRTVSARRSKGMTIDEALDTPLGRQPFFTPEQRKIIRKKGINRGTVQSRMLKGMHFEEAVNMPLMKHYNRKRKVSY